MLALPWALGGFGAPPPGLRPYERGAGSEEAPVPEVLTAAEKGPSRVLLVLPLSLLPVHSPSYTPVTLSPTPAHPSSCPGESRAPWKALWEKRVTIPPPAPPVLRGEARRRALPRQSGRLKRRPPSRGSAGEVFENREVVEGSRVGQEAEVIKPGPENGRRCWQPGVGRGRLEGLRQDGRVQETPIWAQETLWWDLKSGCCDVAVGLSPKTLTYPGAITPSPTTLASRQMLCLLVFFCFVLF